MAPYKVDPSAGSRPADAFNNVGVQVVFALLGVGMVVTALWFFFWAKNGGFRWNGKRDWEDYKSTVLRRKGPDGKTLSNATKSTRLGGGSVVHGGSFGAPTSIGYTDETGTSADFSEMREVEEGKGKRAFGLRGGDAKSKRSRRDPETNRHDPELREYRQERAARVGGLNRQADGMYTDYSNTEPSELGSNVSGRPLIKDKDKAKNKEPKDKKKEAKEKERRAKERMRQAKLAEKEALKTAAANVKAQKLAEKEAARKDKEQKKKSRKAKSEVTSSEPAMTEYTAPSEYTPSEAPAPATRRAPPSAAYSFVTGDDQTVYTGVYTDEPKPSRAAPPETIPESSYYSDYRPNGRSTSKPRESRTRRESTQRPQGSRSRPTSQSPQKQHRSSRQSAAHTAPASDIFTATGPAQGTISYPCHIPGLSTAGSVAVSDSVSQAAGKRERRQRDVMAGYRRGGVRQVRRDSLSDSDN